ncbi:hypothetical protein GCM10023094_01450 [Rhodococcus olei]|uniref:Polysaccharide chain length determinant N-terminal domain-containing protein n=1 Tax=Rhodococcus olei TaxID=2161675 RepID=A0ABP8NTT7_9NOCA
MNATTFVGAVRRHWILFTTVVVACVGLGVGASLLAPTRYVSTTQLLVSSHSGITATTYDDSSVVSGRVNSYVALLTSDAVNQRVVDALKLPESAKDLAANVNATIVPPRTAVIDVSVSDTSPDRARLVADTLAREFVSYTEALEAPAGVDGQRIQTTIVSTASDPRASVPGPWVFALLGLATGVVLGSVAVWIRTATDPIVRSPERAAGVSGLPVIGTVAALPTTRQDGEGYLRLRTRLRSVSGDRADSRDEARVWLISSAAGEATEASDVASNLGSALARCGDRVLLVRAANTGRDDTDPGLSDVLTGSAAIDRTIRVGADDRPDVLPAGTETEAYELLVGADMHGLVAGLRDRYRHLVVETGPVLSTPAAEALSEYADGALLVVVTGTTRRRDLAAAVDRLRSVDAVLTGIVMCTAAPVARAPEADLPDETGPVPETANTLRS